MKKLYLFITACLITAVSLHAQINVFPAGSFDDYADKDALLTEWSLKNGEIDKLELMVSDNDLDPDSEKMLKLVARDASSNDWDLQLATPLIPLVEGNQYMITFDIRSEGTGKLRVSTGAGTQFPGNQYLEHIDTDEEWVTARYIFPYGDPNRPLLAGEAEQVELNFDMGTVAGMVYYLDNIKVLDITDMGFELDGLNLFASGTFDDYADVDAVLAEWSLKNGESEKVELLPRGDGKMLKLVSRATSSNDWDLQLATPLIPLVEGRQYMVTYDIRSEGVGKLRISTGAANQLPGNQYWQHVDTGEGWMTVRHVFLYNDPNRPLIAGPAEAVELNFDMGTVADMTYYLDNVKVIDITGTKLARYVADVVPDPDPVIVNLIPTGDFEDITSVIDEGWALLNGDASLMELVDSDNDLDPASTKVLKMVTPATASNAWDLQLRAPNVTIVPGYQYVLMFDIRSDGDGRGRISAANNQISPQYWPDFNTTEEWQTFKFDTINGSVITAVGETLSITFDLGYVAGMVYYLDNVILYEIEVEIDDPDPVYVNLIPTGDFEDITSVIDEGWALLNGDASLMELVVSDNTLDASSTQMLKMVTPATATNAWDLQLRAPNVTIVPGYQYVLMFDIRSDGDGRGRISAANNQISPQYWPDFNTTEEWQTFKFDTINGSVITAVGETLSITFDLGYVAGMVYYLDNVILYEIEVEIDDTNIAPIVAQLSANVYPNPATNYVIVQMNNLHRAEVWDMTGKLIYSVAGNGLEVNLDISNLNTGIYFVRAIDSNNSAVVRKVIKN